jgi:hypothetical protein
MRPCDLRFLFLHRLASQSEKLILNLLVIGALSSSFASAEVKVIRDSDRVRVEIDGKPFTDFVLKGGEAMKPYLYPLRSATGKIVTRHIPTELVEGEPKDHPHQRGLWFGHEKVNGSDFWNNEANYKSANRGRINVTNIEETQGGRDTGTIRATLEWLDAKGNKVLEERRTMIFREDVKLRIIDFDIKLIAATNVTFGDAKDGAFGIRLAKALQEEGSSGKITNAEGQEREKPVWGKPSDWVDYSGEVEGEKVGITIFDHPQNSRRARWHVRGYGLFAANPFGLRVFTGDKSQDGTLKLEQGGELRFRYRVVIHPGDAKSADVTTLWQDYLKQTK